MRPHFQLRVKTQAMTWMYMPATKALNKLVLSAFEPKTLQQSDFRAKNAETNVGRTNVLLAAKDKIKEFPESVPHLKKPKHTQPRWRILSF